MISAAPAKPYSVLLKGTKLARAVTCLDTRDQCQGRSILSSTYTDECCVISSRHLHPCGHLYVLLSDPKDVLCSHMEAT